MNGVVLEGRGKTFEEALLKISPPQKLTTKCIMRVTAGDETKEKVVRGPQVMKLFSANPMTREIVFKNFQILFGL